MTVVYVRPHSRVSVRAYSPHNLHHTGYIDNHKQRVIGFRSVAFSLQLLGLGWFYGWRAQVGLCLYFQAEVLELFLDIICWFLVFYLSFSFSSSHLARAKFYVCVADNITHIANCSVWVFVTHIGVPIWSLKGKQSPQWSLVGFYVQWSLRSSPSGVGGDSFSVICPWFWVPPKGGHKICS